MSINVGQVYDRLQNAINKDKSGRVYQVSQLNNDLQFVLYSYLKTKYGLPENPQAPQYYEIVQKITDDLSILRVWLGGEKPMVALDASGKFPKPKDYWHPSRMSFVTYIRDREVYKRIDITTDDEFGSRLASPLMKPTRKNPIACIYTNYIQVYPKDLQYIHFVYLRKPATPFYDYDIINDEPVFLPAGERHVNSSVMPQGSLSRTVDIELPDDCMEDIVSIMLADFGLRTREQFPYEVGNQRKITGQ